MAKSVRKSVKCEVLESGSKCIRIYEVYGVRKDNGENYVYSRFLNKKDAEEAKELIDECLNNIYDCSFIIEQFVWC